MNYEQASFIPAAQTLLIPINGHALDQPCVLQEVALTTSLPQLSPALDKLLQLLAGKDLSVFTCMFLHFQTRL